MLLFLRKISFYKFVPLCWTLVTIILLCLPGDVIPSEGIFLLDYLDKLVHFLLFGGIVLFWGLHYSQIYSGNKIRKLFVWITLSSIALGITLEIIQHYFIPNRSFEIVDIIADSVGSLLGVFYLSKGNNQKRKTKG